MIAIISAMPEEMQTILDEMQVKKTITKGKRDYYQGTLYGKEIVLVFSRWGKVAAATTTTQLFNLFHIEEVIFSGVAGGLDEDINIGDIVVGTELIQHDMDASPLYDKMEIPLLGKTAFKTADPDKLTTATYHFLENYNSFFNDEPEKFGIQNPKKYQGMIVSGDQFVNGTKKIKEIKNLVPTALCVEMEGAAVAQVCYEYNIPFQIIRIISDKANDNSHIDFPLFAEKVAGKYAAGIMKYYLG